MVTANDSKLDNGMPKAKRIAEPVDYNTKYINKPSLGKGKGKAIGALIVVVLIIAIIAPIRKFLSSILVQTIPLMIRIFSMRISFIIYLDFLNVVHTKFQ